MIYRRFLLLYLDIPQCYFLQVLYGQKKFSITRKISFANVRSDENIRPFFRYFYLLLFNIVNPLVPDLMCRQEFHTTGWSA